MYYNADICKKAGLLGKDKSLKNPDGPGALTEALTAAKRSPVHMAASSASTRMRPRPPGGRPDFAPTSAAWTVAYLCVLKRTQRRTIIRRAPAGRAAQGLIVAKTETNLDIESVLAAPAQYVLAGQAGGG
jgi:hypothetical protein